MWQGERAQTGLEPQTLGYKGYPLGQAARAQDQLEYCDRTVHCQIEMDILSPVRSSKSMK